MNSFDEVQSLLQDKADIQARIKLIPYDGNTEIKQIASGKYLYTGRKVEKYVESTYVRQRKESVTISSSASIRYPTPSSLMM